MLEGGKNLYAAGLIAWLAMAAGAILNGALREYALAPLLGAAALPLSAVTGSAIFTLITYVLLKWLGRTRTKRELLMLGLMWLALTVAFEFGFGRLAMGKSWGELLAAYDLRTGNLWSAVLVYITFMPLLVSRWLIR